MGGLKLHISGTSGAMPSSSPSWGTASSYRAPVTVAQAAFGPGASSAAPGTADLLHPGQPVGLAFWTGVASIAALVFIRHTLPN